MNYLFIYLSQLMGALNIVSSKVLVSYSAASTLLALRFLFGSLILFALHFITNKKQSTVSTLKNMSGKDWVFLTAQGLCGGVLFNYFMYRGLHYTTASIAGIIMSSLPIIVSLLGFILLKDKLNRTNKICIGLVTLGLIIINLQTNESSGIASNQLLGISLMMIAMLPEASYYLLNRIYRIQVPVYLMSAIVNLINGVILLPFVYTSILPTLYSYGISEWIYLIILSVSSGLFYVFWFLGCRNISATIIALSTALMPLNTLFTAWILLGERINLNQTLGMILVIIAVILSAIKRKT